MALLMNSATVHNKTLKKKTFTLTINKGAHKTDMGTGIQNRTLHGKNYNVSEIYFILNLKRLIIARQTISTLEAIPTNCN